MKTLCFKLLLLITVLVLGSGNIFAQFNWTKYPGNPVMSGSGNGTWDKHVFHTIVIHNTDSSRYEMWYNGSYGPEPSWYPYQIGFAWSADGINWTKYAGNPVLSGTVGSWDESAIQPGWVAREGGQYKMWYYGELANNNSKLGYATSPDGINWTKNPNPILSAGTAAWEAGGVFSPSILKNLGSYTMFYTGADAAGSVCRVGRATSLDGINWQKDTINNPVLSVGALGQWDDVWVAARPNCLKLDNKIYLWYNGASSTTGRRVGIATSTNDGVTWTKYSGNPVLDLGSTGSWDASYVQAGTVLLEGNTFRMWYDGSREPTPTNLWRTGVATAPLVSVSVEQEITLPTEFTLEQNYPNPFNPATTIKYSIPNSSQVTLEIFNTLGEELATLVNEEKPVGTYEVNWYAANLPSGVYFYQLKAGESVNTKKMLLLK